MRFFFLLKKHVFCCLFDGSNKDNGVQNIRRSKTAIKHRDSHIDEVESEILSPNAVHGCPVLSKESEKFCTLKIRRETEEHQDCCFCDITIGAMNGGGDFLVNHFTGPSFCSFA